ncbi:hypothetical protein BDB00DRAFT_803998 [Zychaea mexicana]|uniref:uncharacterized protein n=1 Tax=Zychaea mexicana TaxID=64656 RepID=UPI0022FE4E60|nr:uncharacterized protein BDB00DRAFT_803998 [Zychaea mexicana]KAI9497773.1 hypothetical protein BDB00DRAFT_803998 [Zychaea mexicana]
MCECTVHAYLFVCVRVCDVAIDKLNGKDNYTHSHTHAQFVSVLLVRHARFLLTTAVLPILS